MLKRYIHSHPVEEAAFWWTEEVLANGEDAGSNGDLRGGGQTRSHCDRNQLVALLWGV